MFDEIKPLLNAAKVFGSGPHKIVGQNLVITRKGMIYSLLIITFAMYSFGCKIYRTFDVKKISMATILHLPRSFLWYNCFLVDLIISIAWKNRLESAFDFLHEYDVATKFNAKKHLILNRCRTVLLVVIGFWIVIGFTDCVQPRSNWIESGFFKSDLTSRIIHCLVPLGVSVQILKFCGIILMVHQRFNHLYQLIMPKELLGPKISMVLCSDWEILTLKDVWRLHSSLSIAARRINSIYSPQMFFWISTLFVNALSRTNVLIGRNVEDGIHVAYDILSVIGCLVNMVFIILSCHATSHRANSTTDGVFSAFSTLQRTRRISEDKIPGSVYFCTEKVRFNAAGGLIKIELPLLTSIFGALTTYLVILQSTK